MIVLVIEYVRTCDECYFIYSSSFFNIFIVIAIKLTTSNNLTQPQNLTIEMIENTWASMGYFLHHLEPDIRNVTRRLGRPYLKILKRKLSVVFNQTCIDYDLLPKYRLYIYIYICLIK